MKTLMIASLLLFVTVAALTVHAQRVRLADGKLDFLRSERAINIEFTYDNMSVGKFNKEDDYINSKKDEYNKKEPGRGDNWAKSWVSDREYRFHPKFIEL